MRISFSVFFLFLYFVKTCRSRDVLPVHILEHCKRISMQEPINNQKIVTITNKKSMYPLGMHLPIFQEHNLRPMGNFYTPIVSPKLHTYINLINEILPKCKREALYEQVHVNLEDNSKGKFETVDCNIDKVLKFEKTEDMLNKTIPKVEKANSEEHEKTKTDFNKIMPEDLVNKSKILNATDKNDQIIKNNNNKEFLNNFEIFTNNCSKNHSTKDVNNTRSDEQDTNPKSNIEIVVNEDSNDCTDDQDANIIIHSHEYCEFISGGNNKVQDFSYGNQIDPTYTVQKVIPYDYGQFTRNQYTKTLSDEENYANIYQLGTVTEQDNKYPFYYCTQLETNNLPNRINSNVRKVAVNNYSNVKNIWRSSKNTDVIIKNNPKNIKLFLNYGSSGNKKFNQHSFINSHSNYRNLNNLKAYYPRYVYN